jgi:hypothetical protein
MISGEDFGNSKKIENGLMNQVGKESLLPTIFSTCSKTMGMQENRKTAMEVWRKGGFVEEYEIFSY